MRNQIVSTLLFNKIVDKYYVNDHSGVFTFWSLEPQYRFTYKRFKYCAFYFTAAVGVTFRIASNDKLSGLDSAGGGWFSVDYGTFCAMPSSHVTFLGISLGKDNAANIELGFGTQGILNVGYSRKFLVQQPLHLPYNPRIKLAKGPVGFGAADAVGLAERAELAQRFLVAESEESREGGQQDIG